VLVVTELSDLKI